MYTLYLNFFSACTRCSSESQGHYWLSTQIKDSHWFLVWGVKNGIIGIFLMGKYSWEIRELYGRPWLGSFHNKWIHLEAIQSALGQHWTRSVGHAVCKQKDDLCFTFFIYSELILSFLCSADKALMSPGVQQDLWDWGVFIFKLPVKTDFTRRLNMNLSSCIFAGQGPKDSGQPAAGSGVFG